MPFESQAQRRFMYVRHPAIAKKWSKEYPNQGKLPEHKRTALHKKIKTGMAKAFPKD